jgi:hypothetical protein
VRTFVVTTQKDEPETFLSVDMMVTVQTGESEEEVRERLLAQDWHVVECLEIDP